MINSWVCHSSHFVGYSFHLCGLVFPFIRALFGPISLAELPKESGKVTDRTHVFFFFFKKKENRNTFLSVHLKVCIHACIAILYLVSSDMGDHLHLKHEISSL